MFDTAPFIFAHTHPPNIEDLHHRLCFDYYPKEGIQSWKTEATLPCSSGTNCDVHNIVVYY